MVELNIKVELRDLDHCEGCPCKDTIVANYTERLFCNVYKEYLTIGSSGPIRLAECKEDQDDQ